MSIAVIGNKYLVTGMRLVGIRGIAVSSDEEAESAVRKLASEGYKIILLPESLAIKLRRLREEFLRSKKIYPLIAVIPDLDGSRGQRLDEIYQIISRAVGVRLKLG